MERRSVVMGRAPWWRRRWRLLAATLPPLVVWLLPASAIPLAEITVMQQRTLALFVLAVLYWILEPIPIFATSVLLIALECLLMSTGGFEPLTVARVEEPGFGPLLDQRAVLASFAEPIIILFLGGFFLALAATKYRLDTNLARVLLRPFGTRPRHVMLGLMVITALFSMFMSNTATTAMMLAVLVPVLRGIDGDDPGRVGLVLAIPLAANIGGIGTPIGTPPNAVAMKYLTGADAISFTGWMAFAVPYVVVMLLLAWLVLGLLFKARTAAIEVEIEDRFPRTPQALMVYATFALTILLWLTGPLHGISSYVVAMVPVSVFTATGVVTARDLRGLAWDVLWLVAGGFALGLAMERTGLSAAVVEAIPFAALPPLAIVAAAATITMLMATFMSNTATANLLMPIMVALAVGIPAVGTTVGLSGLLLAVTFAASLGMAMPISTPPNAMAHATGMIATRDLLRAGGILAVIGLVTSWLLLGLLGLLGVIGPTEAAA